MHPGTAGTEAAVREVELVAVAPSVTLLDFTAFIVHVPACQVVFDETSYGAALDEVSQNFDRETEERGNARHVGLGARALHFERVATVESLAVLGR